MWFFPMNVFGEFVNQIYIDNDAWKLEKKLRHVSYTAVCVFTRYLVLMCVKLWKRTFLWNLIALIVSEWVRKYLQLMSIHHSEIVFCQIAQVHITKKGTFTILTLNISNIILYCMTPLENESQLHFKKFQKDLNNNSPH